MTNKLSPAAQAVLDAYWTDKGFIVAEDINKSIAAALRAAVDQVLPKGENLSNFAPGGPQAFALQRRVTRRELLAIANELENADG